MSNIFYRQFYHYIHANHNEHNGKFYESSGTLIYEMKKEILDWNVIGQVRFPERQCIQILYRYKYIEVVNGESKIFPALNTLNSMDGAFARFFYLDKYIYASVELFPDNGQYDVTVILQMIDALWRAMAEFIYDCIESAIKADEIKNEQEKQNKDYNQILKGDSDEYPDSDEPDWEEIYISQQERNQRTREHLRDLADYYGYQEDSDYSYEQFLDDL